MQTIERSRISAATAGVGLLEPARRPSVVVAPAPRPVRVRRPRSLLGRRHHAVGEIGLILAALAAYLVVRALTSAQRGVALAHADAVLRAERALSLAHETDAQGWIRAHDAATTAANVFYVWAFWPMVAGALILLHRRSARGFVDLRNALFLSGLVGLLVFALFPVAPPRMLPGFHDTIEMARTQFVAHPSSFSNEYAAVPSFHVGWTALACAAIAAQLRSRLARALVAVPAVLMALTVVATANHFIVDGILGAGLSLGAWAALRARARRAAG